MKIKPFLLNKLFLILIITGSLLGFILSTDPNKIALPLLIVPFILLGFILYHFVTLVLLLTKAHKNGSVRKITALSVAALGVSLLLLQSLHQLTWKDGLLTVVFAILFWLYIWRADFLHR